MKYMNINKWSSLWATVRSFVRQAYRLFCHSVGSVKDNSMLVSLDNWWSLINCFWISTFFLAIFRLNEWIWRRLRTAELFFGEFSAEKNRRQIRSAAQPADGSETLGERANIFYLKTAKFRCRRERERCGRQAAAAAASADDTGGKDAETLSCHLRPLMHRLFAHTENQAATTTASAAPLQRCTPGNYLPILQGPVHPLKLFDTPPTSTPYWG